MAAAPRANRLPDIARRVFEEQAHLIHAQCTEIGCARIGEGVRAALWAILAVAAAAILALIIVVVFAPRSDALVVQSFRVPPSLAAKGLTGEVVATQVLDKLAQFQDQSKSARAASSYANNWEDELKIDIPNTGANADQLWKLLRGWLGKETRISGEIIETTDGLALTARVGATSARTLCQQDRRSRRSCRARRGADLSQHPALSLCSLCRPGSEARFRALRDPQAAHRRPFSGGAQMGLQRSRFDSLSRGDWAGAIAMARRALAIDPANVAGVQQFGEAHQ